MGMTPEEQAAFAEYKAAVRADIRRLEGLIATLQAGVRTNITELRDADAAHAATAHGDSADLTEERVKEIVRELVAE